MEFKQKLTMKFDADCVEAHPGDSNDTKFVCATYQLDKETGNRVGNMSYMQHTNDNVEKLGELDTPAGVFDAKWSSSMFSGKDSHLLACACADAQVHFYLPDGETGFDNLQPSFSSGPLGESSGEVFCLSVDFDDRAAVLPCEDGKTRSEYRIAASCSDGSLSLVSVSEERGVEVLDSWLAHTYYGGDSPAEVWITGFNCHDTNVVYSGADDHLLKSWDVRLGGAKPTAISKAHTAGVCSLQTSIHHEHLLATGCYDHKLRLWDTRKISKPLFTSGDLGGGIWRVKWNPNARYEALILTACMRGGFQVQRLVEEPEYRIETVAKYSESGNEDWEVLAYGADWIDERNLGVCTFYDKTFRLLGFDCNITDQV